MYTIHSLFNTFSKSGSVFFTIIAARNAYLLKEWYHSKQLFSFSKRHKKKTIYLELTPQEIMNLKNAFKVLGLKSKTEYVFDLNSDKKIDLAVFSSASLQKNKNTSGIHREQQTHQNGIIKAFIKGIPVTDIQTLLQELEKKVDLEKVGIWSYLNRSSFSHTSILAYSTLKAIVDPFIALILLVLLLPVFAIVSAVIWIRDGRPIFYTQVRTGYRGKNFTLIKFRSMPVNAEQNGPQFCSTNDNRAYPFGQWLRKTRLDELPQLINVIRGELRLVGPRPERPEFYETFKNEIRYFPLRTTVFPGITGWAQLRAGYAASAEESKTKLEYDLHYILKMSPKLDFLILLETALLLINSLMPKWIIAKKNTNPTLLVTTPINQAREEDVLANDSLRCTFSEAKTNPKTQYG